MTGLDLPGGVQPVHLDLAEPDNADAALAGVDVIFLCPTRVAPTEFSAAAAKAGVRYVVLLSSPEVCEGAPDNPIRLGHRVGIAYPEGRFTPIHEDDIAEVVAGLLTTDRYPDTTLSPTGPESLTQAEIVAILAGELGRPLTVDALTRQQAQERREPGCANASSNR